MFSNTECGAKQNWNHSLNGPPNTQSLSQHLKHFKHNQDSSCRRNNLFPVKANWILTSKTRRKTHQKRTYRDQRWTRDFFYIKNTWHFIVESYRVFMKINLYIKTISLRGHFLDFRSRCYTAISRKVVGKNVHATIPKGNMGYDQYTVPDDCSCRSYFCCFPLALANTFPRHFVPIPSYFFEKKRTQNHPQCLSGLARIVACTFPDNLSRNSCIYFLVPLSWAGVTFVETIVFIWYWCSLPSVVNRSRVSWKRRLFACE